MNEPIEELYFNWLYSKVCDVRARRKSQQFTVLMGELHRTEYIWLLSGDDNRAKDGCDLRDEFLMASNLIVTDDSWQYVNCSVLEMLIAFSRRASFETTETPVYWFWMMLTNLGLANLSDATHPDEDEIRAVLDRFIWRTYDARGNGGLFPLRDAELDQRFIEVRYQFSEYLYQNNLG